MLVGIKAIAILSITFSTCITIVPLLPHITIAPLVLHWQMSQRDTADIYCLKAFHECFDW